MNKIVIEHVYNDIKILLESFDLKEDDLKQDDLDELTKNTVEIYKLFFKMFNDSKSQDFTNDYFKQLICKFYPKLNKSYKFIETKEDKLSFKERLEELKLKPKHKQKSKKWFDFRKTALTASNITKILSGNNINKIILDKCGVKSSFVAGSAILHGVKYEEIAIKIYESRTSKKIYEFGCVRHENIPFLAASPDGIDEDGTMIEIKCVYSRKITGIPKKMYYDQMQLQMEVCELNKCIFLECGILEYDHFDDYKNDFLITDGNIDETKNKNGKEKGVIFRFVKKNGTIKYKYAPINLNHKQVEKWVNINHNKTRKKDPNYKIYNSYEPLYWYLDTISCIPIYKDKNWILKNIPIFVKCWKTIKYYKNKKRYLSLIKKKKKKIKNKIFKKN